MTLVGHRAQWHPKQVRRNQPGLWEEEPFGIEVDDRSLPRKEFALLDDRFRFTVDAAAAEHNARLERYWSVECSGLEQPWCGERVYCNPPFSDIRPWVEKAWSENADLVVMLLPANRTEQSWWQGLVEPRRDRKGSPLRVEFLPGRNRFLKPGQTEPRPGDRPPFGCCLLIWNESDR